MGAAPGPEHRCRRGGVRPGRGRRGRWDGSWLLRCLSAGFSLVSGGAGAGTSKNGASAVASRTGFSKLQTVTHERVIKPVEWITSGIVGRPGTVSGGFIKICHRPDYGSYMRLLSKAWEENFPGRFLVGMGQCVCECGRPGGRARREAASSELPGRTRADPSRAVRCDSPRRPWAAPLRSAGQVEHPLQAACCGRRGSNVGRRGAELPAVWTAAWTAAGRMLPLGPRCLPAPAARDHELTGALPGAPSTSRALIFQHCSRLML